MLSSIGGDQRQRQLGGVNMMIAQETASRAEGAKADHDDYAHARVLSLRLKLQFLTMQTM